MPLRTFKLHSILLWIVAYLSLGGEPESFAQFKSYALEVNLSCSRAVLPSSEPLPCQVYLLALPEGGPMLVPRTLPPFRIPSWPDLKIEFEIRQAGLSFLPLEISPEADRGRWDIRMPLEENGLLILRPGELYGWTFDLNGRDWILPNQGRYFLRAKIRMHFQNDGQKGELESAVRAKLGRHPEYKNLVVPDGEFYSNEVEVCVETEE